MTSELKKCFYFVLVSVLFGGLFSVAGARDFIIRDVSAPTTIRFKVDGTTGNVGIGTSTPQAPIHANGGTAMTSGWNRTAMLSATFPVLVFNSNSTKYAGIGYDYSSNLNVWVNAATNDVVTGTNALTIAQNGNVGVGKTPTVKLDVNGTVKATAFEGPLSGTISAANVSSGSFGANTGGGNYVFPASLGIGGMTSAVPLHVRDTTTTGLRTSMQFSQTGSIAGAGSGILFKSSSTETADRYGVRLGAVRAPAGNGAAEFVVQLEKSTLGGLEEVLRIDQVGNLGVGIALPTDKLHVSTGSIGLSNTNSVNTSQGTVKFYSPTYPAAYAGIEGKTNADGTNQLDLLFYTAYGSAAEKMRILSNSGNVGIGTSAPGQKLTVAGTIESTSGGVKFPDGTTQATAYLGGSQTTSAANVSSGDFGANTGGGNYSFPGSLGVGAVLAGVNMNISGTLAAPAKMYVTNTGGTWVDEGEIGRYGFYTTDSSGIGARELAGIRGVSGQAGTTAAGELAFYTSLYNTAGAEAMRIDKSGNVGIGTVSPTSKLDVNGTITATGFSGPLTGTVSAANVSAGSFAANTGGGNFVFPGDVTVTGNLISGTGGFAREYKANIGGISSAGWTNIAFVNGTGLNSKVRLTMGGTTGSVVVDMVADIIVNHSYDIYVRTESGSYTLVTLLITSDSNEDFYIQAKTNSANVLTADCRVFTYGGEVVTMAPASVSGVATLQHVAKLHQLSISSTGGGEAGVNIGEMGIRRVSATSMGIYDSANALVVEYDEGI